MPVTRREFLRANAAAILWAGMPAPQAGPLQTTAAQATRPRLKRKDSFFGIHFDLHPNRDDTILGRDVTEQMIETFLRRVSPDYVQYDCKGHPGYAGYPSLVGIPSPGIVKDSLEIWRRVTARHGVALYIHYSGVWDSVACERHPDWAATKADGKPDKDKTSTFGPYVDRLLIPQLLEVSEKYDLDGAWIDGECWAVIPDYGEGARRRFAEATGLTALPSKPGEPGWREFLDLNREQFRRYVRHYLEALHATRPQFQVASNWLYSTMVPERPDLPVDFLSGDYLGNASISTARLEARYLAATGKPWDLMAWGFQSGKSFMHKPSVQLMQEAAVVLAQGGGFQIYYQPSRAGHLDASLIEVMGRVADWCRARQPFCHKTEPVPGIGVLFSSHDLYKGDRLFGGWGAAINPARGVVDALVECHHSVDVVPDWRLDENLAHHPLVVVPDWPDIGESAREALVRYARGGGSLLLVGAGTARLFAPELGVEFDGKPAEQPAFVIGKEVPGNATGLWQAVRPVEAVAIETRYPAIDTTRDGACAATVVNCGHGRIAAVYGPVGVMVASSHAPAVREFLDRVVRRVYAPQVEIDGPPTLEAALRKTGSRYLLHLCNATNMQVAADYAVNDFVPSVGPVGIRVRLPVEPRSARIEPGGRVVRGEWSGGVWTGTVPSVHVHSVVVFET
jgi:hypothetical protein